MRKVCKTSRCVRRFALFPKKLYAANEMETWIVWLEFYYVIQRRNSGFAKWRDSDMADKEIWKRWRC